MNRVLLVVGCALVLMSGGASAEVYKWKDAGGQVRYSDVPPASNIPYQTLGGKKSTPSAASPAPADVSKPAKTVKTPADKELDARKRQADAEDAKQKDEAKLAEQKLREQNCATARANLQNYQQGGRVYKMDEKGEREYLDDAALAKGLEQAHKDVEEWCPQ